MDLLIDLESFTAGAVPSPLHKRLSSAIRDAILDGRLKPGQPVPSLRRLSNLASVCRATAQKAYEDLQRQGLITSDKGRGTFVCDRALENIERSSSFDNVCTGEDQSVPISLFARTLCDDSVDCQYADRSGGSALVKVWKRISQKHVERINAPLDQRAVLTSETRVRAVVQDYLIRSRAVSALGRQLLFSSSNEYLLFLATRILIGSSLKRFRVILGTGSSPAVRAGFAAHGTEIVECPVDDYGLDLDKVKDLVLADADRCLTCIYVNPSHHHSNGVVMSLERRLGLIAFARATGALIIEDDIESEYRYATQPLPSIQGLSGGDNVFYLSSINSLMPPPIRVALMVVPQSFVAASAVLTNEDDVAFLTMAILADLIEDGHLEVFIRKERRARVLLKQKLIYSITRHMLNTARVITQTTANRQVLHVSSPLRTEEIVHLANSCGLVATSTAEFYTDGCERKELCVRLDEIDEDLENKIAAWSGLLAV